MIRRRCGGCIVGVLDLLLNLMFDCLRQDFGGLSVPAYVYDFYFNLFYFILFYFIFLFFIFFTTGSVGPPQPTKMQRVLSRRENHS